MNNLAIGTFTRSFGNSKIFQSFSILPNYLKKQKTRKILTSKLHATVSVQPYGYCFFICAFPYGCGPALGRSLSITIFLLSGPFDDNLSWPFRGTIQINVFRQDNSGLLWTNLLKKNDKTIQCFSRPSHLQPNPSCGFFFSLPHEDLLETHKNLIENDNVYIKIKIFDCPWTPVSIPANVYSGWDVVFDKPQREREKEKLWKTRT